jgi:hypothetical protein
MKTNTSSGRPIQDQLRRDLDRTPAPGPPGRDQDEDGVVTPLASWSGYSGRLRRLLGRFSAGLSARRPW